MKKRNKRSKQSLVIEWTFPDVYKSVAVALLTHYPSLREADMQTILQNRVFDETIRFVTKTVKNFSPNILAKKLNLIDDYVEMVIPFNSQLSPMAAMVRNESNDRLIDATIASEARKPKRTISLPNRRQ